MGNPGPLGPIWQSLISNIGLLTTALTEPGEMTLSFPSRTLLCESSLDQVATIPLHITVNVPSYWDRVFISIWCSYNGYDMMVGVLYNPFPYYQYLIRTVNVNTTLFTSITSIRFHFLLRLHSGFRFEIDL